MQEVIIGGIGRSNYSSVTYLGEVKEDRGERYLIEVLAVYKHPMQGDIHNPGEVKGVFFHERKALAHHEKMNVKKPAVHPYDEEIPEYGASLKQAVQTYREKLEAKDSEFNQAALQKLEGLEGNIYKKKYY